MSENVGHPMPAGPLPWQSHANEYANNCILDAKGDEVFIGYNDDPYILWAANHAPALAVEVARLRAALEEIAGSLTAVNGKFTCCLASEVASPAMMIAREVAREALAVSP